MRNKRAIIEEFGSPSVIKIIETNLPEPKSGEVRVRIEASTVSATDVFIRKGIYPLLKEKPPFTIGYDFVGIVDKVAVDVMEVKPGDRVAGVVMTGGNANYICVPALVLTTIPKETKAELAECFTLSGITAYQMFMHYAQVKQRAHILIHGGSGAVGDTLLQLGKLYSCTLVTTASASKHALIKKEYGATTLDYHAPDYYKNLMREAREGFDAIFDFTNQKSFNTSYQLLKKGGTLVTYAVFTSSLKIKKKSLLNFMAFGFDFGMMMLKLTLWNALPNGKKAIFYGSSDSRK